MNDPDLFAAGVTVTLLFLSGVYIAFREGLLGGGEDDDER
jgi:hypothetical protein